MNNELYEVKVNGQTVLVNEELYNLCVTQPKSERRAERRRKQDRYIIDQETATVTYIPSREDSFERLSEAGVEFDAMFRDIEAAEAKIVVTEAMKVLTELQTDIIIKLFFYIIHENVISEEYKITQPAVCQIKDRALEKMKKELTKRRFLYEHFVQN